MKRKKLYWYKNYDENCNFYEKNGEIGKVFIKSFKRLFSSNNSIDCEEVNSIVQNVINKDIRTELDKVFIADKVQRAIMSMKPNVAYTPKVTHLFYADEIWFFSWKRWRMFRRCIGYFTCTKKNQGNSSTKIKLSFLSIIILILISKSKFNKSFKIKWLITSTNKGSLKDGTITERSKEVIFNDIIERFRRKLKGWKEKIISQEWRSVLIKIII